MSNQVFIAMDHFWSLNSFNQKVTIWYSLNQNDGIIHNNDKSSFNFGLKFNCPHLILSSPGSTGEIEINSLRAVHRDMKFLAGGSQSLQRWTSRQAQHTLNTQNPRDISVSDAWPANPGSTQFCRCRCVWSYRQTSGKWNQPTTSVSTSDLELYDRSHHQLTDTSRNAAHRGCHFPQSSFYHW